MIMSTRLTISAVAAALLLAPSFLPSAAPFGATATVFAQGWYDPYRPGYHHRKVRHAKPVPGDDATPLAAGEKKAAPPAASNDQQPPPRVPFTAAEDAAAAIPGIPDARFWADSATDYINALPAQPGPWLVFSSGGGDGAFGAGLLVGLGAAGNRPEYSVVTGVSTGALMAPFVFAGPRYDDTLRNNYTKLSAADVFEAGRTSESFVEFMAAEGDNR